MKQQNNNGVIERAERFVAEISRRLSVTANYSTSSNDFGTSCYVYLKGIFAETVKCRISDHSTGLSRLLSEFHVSDPIEAAAELERMAFPNRFRKVSTQIGSKRIEWAESAISSFQGPFEIVGQRVTKKGTTQLLIEVPVFEIKWVRN